MSNNNLPANVIALLKAFLVVADTLNISQAAQKLDISRVTLQNRIKQLEDACGYPLLEFDSHNRYKLTPRAENWAQEVKVWLRRGEDIFSLSEERSNGLLQSIAQPGNEPFYFQQHPVTSLWDHNTPYLCSMFEDWVKAKAKYNSPAMANVCENSFCVRLRNDEFVIMSVGAKAAIMNWLGRDWCLSSIGKPLSSTAIATKADQFVTYAYRQVILLGMPWYDHVIMDIPKSHNRTHERAYYRRLILPCKLPDGSPVVASVVELSDELVIGDIEVPSKRQAIVES